MRKRSAISTDRQRRTVIRGLAAALTATLTGGNRAALASVFGERPAPLPEGRSVYRATGPVTLNGNPVTAETRIGPGDRLATGRGATLIAVVGRDGILLRENSELELAAVGRVVRRGFRLITGALLSVFDPQQRDRIEITTRTVALGIRGTGIYTEAAEDRSYVCVCYGTVDLASTGGKPETERIVSRYHDAPRYVLAAPDASGRRIVPAPFINHTDAELMMLEALLGRTVPFGLGTGDYDRPRREY
jgi:hypothetical protein